MGEPGQSPAAKRFWSILSQNVDYFLSSTFTFENNAFEYDTLNVLKIFYVLHDSLINFASTARKSHTGF